MPEPTPPEMQPAAVPSNGHDLPAEPLNRSVMPADVKPHLGRLVMHSNKTGRPFVGVLVSCRKCKRLHRYPWRWLWGVGLDVVSRQAARCPDKGARKPVWVALDPATEAENVATHQAANEAYVAWEAVRAARKAARAAEADLGEPAAPPLPEPSVADRR